MFIDEYIKSKLKLIEEEWGDILHLTSRRAIANDVYLILGIHQLEYEQALTRLPTMTKMKFFKVVDAWYDSYRLRKKLEILTGELK